MILGAVRMHLALRVVVSIAAMAVMAVSFFVMNAVEFHEEFPIFLTAELACISAFMIFILYGLSPFFWIVVRDQHPWLKPLHEFGDPIEAAKSIDADLAAGTTETWGEPFAFNLRCRLKPAVMVSENWIVHFGKIGLIVVPLAEVVAVHREVRRGRISWGRKGEFHSVRVIAPHRAPYVLDMPTQESIEWLGRRIIERRPAILFGDTGEYRRIENDGRYSMLDAVKQREQRYSTLSAEEQKEWKDDAVDEFLWCIDARFF